MYKKLLLGVCCLCAVSGVWASEKKEEVVEIKEEKKTEKKQEVKTYTVKIGDATVTVSSRVVESMRLLRGMAEGREADADSSLVLAPKNITVADFNVLAEMVEKEVVLKDMTPQRLVSLISAANYVGADGTGSDKRNLVQELCEELASRITENDWDEYAQKGKGIFVEVKNLPDDVFKYVLSPLLTPIVLKEPKLLWEETISDQDMLSCVVANGMIATAKIKKEGEFFVAEEVVLADPLKKQETITLKGKFSFNDREVFNVLFLPQNQIAIITVDMIQVFDRKTTERTSFIAKPRNPEFESVHASPNYLDDFHIPAGYLSQNCAVVCADSTIVCTSDEGLFVWKIGAAKGTTIKVELRSHFRRNNNFKVYPFIYNSLPRLFFPGDACITGLARLADNNVGIILHERGVAIYNIEDCRLKCSINIESVDFDTERTFLIERSKVPSFSLLTMSSGNIYYISNDQSKLFCCDKCQAKECKDDFFPEKPNGQKVFPFGRIIRDTVVLGGDIFAMNTTESDDKKSQFLGDYVKIGKSLRDCVAISVEPIKYQRFGDYRLFNVGNGRIMLEQHDRTKQKIHRKMWKVVIPVEGSSCDEILLEHQSLKVKTQKLDQPFKKITSPEELLTKIAQLEKVLREYRLVERQIIAQEHPETLQQRKPGFWERVSNFWQKKPVVVEQQETVETLKQKNEELWKKAETLEAKIKQDAKLLEYGEDKILPFETLKKIREEKAKETQSK